MLLLLLRSRFDATTQDKLLASPTTLVAGEAQGWVLPGKFLQLLDGPSILVEIPTEGRFDVARAFSLQARYFAERIRAATSTQWNWAVVRAVSNGLGEQNPPRANALATAQAHSLGDTVLRLRGAPLVGTIVAGDGFAVSGYFVRATSAVQAVRGAIDPVTNEWVGTVNIPIAPAIPAPIPQGTEVIPAWKADRYTTAQVIEVARAPTGGSLTEFKGATVVVSALELEEDPTTDSYIILPDGRVTKVIEVDPIVVQGEAVGFRLKVR